MTDAQLLASFAPMGVALALLGTAVLTAVYDSWWSQRRRRPTTATSTERAAWRHAA